MITYILYFLYIFNIFDISLSYYISNETDESYSEDQSMIARVYNGWPAKLGDVPYQISFKMRIRKYKYASFCGGVIIAPEKLLSAAHCFVTKPTMCENLCGISGKINKDQLYHTYAVAGQLKNKENYRYQDSPEIGQWRALKHVRYPPGYKFPKLDFAIVFLEAPFKYDSYVNEIPYASKFVDYDGKCLVSGFGRTSPKKTSSELLLAHLTLIPWKECNRRHRRMMTYFVCTSSQFTDVGKGDSGGPLVCLGTGDPNESSRGILVGIVSGHAYGIGTFFTRVSSYYNYVKKNKSCVSSPASLRLMLMLNLIQVSYFTILILFYFIIDTCGRIYFTM